MVADQKPKWEPPKELMDFVSSKIKQIETDMPESYGYFLMVQRKGDPEPVMGTDRKPLEVASMIEAFLKDLEGFNFRFTSMEDD